MSKRKPPAAAKRLTRRRDDDPVKVFQDFRVAWWPSGVPGVASARCGAKGAQRRQAPSPKRSTQRSTATGFAVRSATCHWAR
jgi:hypothetical protein